ncbi:hypothetical protein [Marinifilum flexuosum]|uniref:hypothetical protein n=1 Tax=Marinifilum flexuosum TaxID=1117708 RepID=UPI002494FDF9|nr:hypothetical protein [Marinifilum flexuosum]
MNDDSLYYKKDTITLFEDINHLYNAKTCSLIRWTLNKRTFKISNVYRCTEPGRISAFTDKEKISIGKTDYGQVISLKRNGKVFDKFKITDYQVKQVERYPYEIKELCLMRFDKLSECKLLSYVNSLIHKVMDNGTITEPLIVVNGHLIEDKEILKSIRLVETLSIEFIPQRTSGQVFDKANNGVILVSVSKKKFKKEWRNYGS